MAGGVSGRLFKNARRYLAGGVNSPVRSFRAVGGCPLFVREAHGSRIFAEDGRELVDYCLSFGALILGHAHPRIAKRIGEAAGRGSSFGAPTRLETELAELITGAMPSVEKLRMVNSGTEAAMGAVRLARAFTKKEKIIKFEGAYHGSSDCLLDCPGVPRDSKKHVITLPYNHAGKAEEAIGKHGKELAAVIVEPVAGNMGVVLPRPGFLEALKEATERHGVLLIFDEVITGFRLSYGGAQGMFKIRPDITCLGKIIGGGLPCGAFGGRGDIMGLLAPEGEVYQAGTFSGNPLAVSAGIETLTILKESSPYGQLRRETERLCRRICSEARSSGIAATINRIGSMFSIFFTDGEVADYDAAKKQDAGSFGKFFHGLLERGVYLPPSGFEANFVSAAHTRKDTDLTLDAARSAFEDFGRGGLACLSRT